MEELLKVLVLITVVLVFCRLVDYFWIEDEKESYDGEFIVDEVTPVTFSYSFDDCFSKFEADSLENDNFHQFMKGDKISIEGTNKEELERKKTKLFNRTLGTVIDNRIERGKFTKKKPRKKIDKNKFTTEGFIVVGDLLELGNERRVKRPYVSKSSFDGMDHAIRSFTKVKIGYAKKMFNKYFT